MRRFSILAVGRSALACSGLIAITIGVPSHARAQQNDPVFETNGFQQGRALLALQPFEHFDTVTGNMILTFTDLTLPGNAGFDLSFVRTYNTRTGQWHFGIAGVPMYLISDTGPQPELLTAVTFYTADRGGHRAEVGVGPNTTATKDFWIFDTVAHTLSLPSGIVATYNEQVGPYTWYVTDVRDTFGNSVTFNWAGLGQLASVTQNLGAQSRTVTFQGWSNFHLDSMSYLGRMWSYTWDANPVWVDDLRLVTSPVGTKWAYDYATFSGPYSAALHSINVVTTPTGGTITYGITQVEVFRPAPLNYFRPWVVVSRTTGGRAPSGPWTFTYGAQTTDIDTPSGHLHFEWQPHNDQAVQWKRQLSSGTTVYEDEETQYTDVSFGSLQIPVVSSRTLTRDGRTFSTTYSYSPTNNGDWGHPSTIQETGELSRTTNIVYRHSFSPNYIRGRVESVSHDSFTRSFEYDNETGFLTRQTIYGVSTEFTPDGFGNVASVKDANDRPTSFTYDWGVLKNTNRPEDPITRTINPDGTVASERVGITTTSFSYDAIGRITSLNTETSGREPTTTTYNLSGGVWDYTTVTRGSSSVSTDLDGFGQPTGTLDSAGVRTSTGYDAEGRVTSRRYPEVGGNGPEETYAYDPLGRLTSVVLPEDGRVTYEYVSGGSEIRIHERNFGNNQWRTTRQNWQAFGDPSDARLSSLIDAHGEPWTYFYNGLGQLTRVLMPGGAERTWDYDSRGFLTRETHPESGPAIYVPDAVGNVISKTTDAGPIGYTYDGINRLRRIDAPGTADDVTIDYTAYQRITRTPLVDSTFTYDSANRLIERKDQLWGVAGGLNVRHNYTYDGSDNLTEIADDLTGRRVVYDYGAEHRLTRVRSAIGQALLQDVITDVGYHPSGAISAYNFANGKSFSVSFDGRHRPRDWANGALNVTLGYDQIGNVTSVTDNSGLNHGATYQYDGLDRLTQVLGYGQRTIGYDNLGNQSNNGANSYTYDPTTLRLATRNGNPTSGSYTYNAVGSTTSDPSGSSFAHTAFQQLQSANVNVNGTWTETTYKYDGDGLRTFRRIGQNGEEHYFLHGPGSELLAEYKHVNGTLTPVREYISIGDRVVASVDSGTGTVPACDRDFDEAIVANQTPVRAAHVTELRTAINCVRGWYNLAPFGWTDPTLTQNVTSVMGVHIENLRTALDQAYAAAQQTHDGYHDAGALAGVGIKAIHFNELRDFVRNLIPPQPATTAMHYYHTDWLGSVRQITDANGGQVIRLEYFPFGEGTPLNGDPMRFTGKELDFESALHYFNARYYSMVDGRFTSVDPYLDPADAMVDPQQWNRYSYVANNPVVYVDPDGLQEIRYSETITVHANGQYEDVAYLDAGDLRFLLRSLGPMFPMEEAIYNAGAQAAPIVPVVEKALSIGLLFTRAGGVIDCLAQSCGGAGWAMAAITGRGIGRATNSGKAALYRAVSNAEFEQIVRTGTFQSISTSLEGKWFARTAADAATWGERLHGSGNYRIVEASVGQGELAKMFHLDTLDRIGPAVYAELQQLATAVIRVVR